MGEVPKEASSAVAIDDLLEIVYAAGREILQWYGNPGEVESKDNASPLTRADRAAHSLLVRELSAFTPDVPVLSEESPEEEVRDRRTWRRFWLVDPLDGTKEFLKGSGEFTVNVALVEEGRPVLGVVHVPPSGRTYRSTAERGAELGGVDDPFRSIRTRPFPSASPVLVASRDHAGPGVEALVRELDEKVEGTVEFTSMGSSLKFCIVAEGKADLYLRDRPTMEWDTGAAQSVLERAGGGVYSLAAGASLAYNKESLRNPPFLAVGDPSGPWRDLIHQTRL